MTSLMPPKNVLFYLVIWHFAVRTKAQIKDCFYYDGRPSPDFPCDPEAEVSACCGSGSECATNIYCIGASDDVLLVGSCTDRKFKDAACPWPLNPGEKFQYDQNVTICDDNTICPNKGNDTCCEANGGKIEINFHNNGRIPSEVESLSAYYAPAGYTIPVSTAGTSSSTVTPTTSSETSGTGSSLVSTISSSSSTSDLTPTTSPTSLPGSSTLTAGSKAGIAVGVIFGVALIGFFFFFLLHRRRKLRKTNAMTEPNSAMANLPEMSGTSKPTEIDDTSHPRGYVAAPELSG